ncbi:hypothetical protein [Streptomyces griseoviridis]
MTRLQLGRSGVYDLLRTGDLASIHTQPRPHRLHPHRLEQDAA